MSQLAKFCTMCGYYETHSRRTLRSFRMTPLIVTSSGFLWIVFSAFQPIIHKPLDENVIYGIQVAYRSGTTTVLFPAAISGIYGQRVAKQVQENAGFLVNFVPGSSHFTLRALHDRAEDHLTILFERKAYVLHLTTTHEAHLIVSFFSSKSVVSEKSAETPARLLSILDRAKAYSHLVKGSRDALVGVERVAPNYQTYYEDFRVILREVFRFDPEDALVFHIELENESDHLIHYRPDELAVRLGDSIYVQAIADASGAIPPKGKGNAYFAIVGMPGGGRNNLHSENPWNVLVVRAGGKTAKK